MAAPVGVYADGCMECKKQLTLSLIHILKITTDCEVVDVNGKVIEGLYAAGLNAGGWVGPYYPGSGTAVIGTCHFGRKAGAAAAKRSA